VARCLHSESTLFTRNYRDQQPGLWFKQNRNKTSYDSYRVDGYQQAKGLKPSQAIGPPNVDLAGQPSLASSLGVPNEHARAVQGLVWTAVSLHHLRQMQGYLLDETQSVAH
jgi:hypothetical protein